MNGKDAGKEVGIGLNRGKKEKEKIEARNCLSWLIKGAQGAKAAKATKKGIPEEELGWWGKDCFLRVFGVPLRIEL